jgi:Bacterial conjugation TrbI-like protein
MNRAAGNGLAGTAITQEPSEDVGASGLADRNGKMPFVPSKGKPRPSLEVNGRLIFIGAGIVLVLLLFAFSGVSHRSSPAHKESITKVKAQNAIQPEDHAEVSVSITPILDAGSSLEQEPDGSQVNPDQLGHLAKQTKQIPAPSLADIPPFNNSETWQPPSYQAGPKLLKSTDNSMIPTDATHDRSGDNVMDKVSLVFVKNNAAFVTPQKAQNVISQIEPGIGLPPGTRLRARLESAISTAVHTPVVAVIEYSYEQNREIVIPAGSKVLGHLETADRLGNVGIRFDSLLMPDGSSVNVDASATDVQLRPLRGKVEGKHTGGNILVRSFAGVGEIAATLVGRGSLNQPVSQADLLRERITNNIGQASDQSIANLDLTEHIVVSVPAGTEIYVILEKSAQKNVRQSSYAQLPAPASQRSIEELRQLIQLQRELNQADATRPLE